MKTFLENRHLKNYNTCVRHTKRDKWIYIEQASHNRVFLSPNRINNRNIKTDIFQKSISRIHP